MFDIKTYGAIGNGTSDDTLAIQAAINAAQSAGGGEVLFPDGANSTYLIGSNATEKKITLYSNVVLTGYAATLLMGNGGASIKLDPGAVGRPAASNVMVKGLTFNCAGLVLTTSTTTVTPGTVTVTVANIANITVGSYQIIDFDLVDEEIVQVTAVSGSTFTASFTKAHSGTWAVGLGAAIYSVNPTNGTYQNNRFRDNTFNGIPAAANAHALTFTASAPCYILNNTINGCGGDAINCNNGYYFTQGNYVMGALDGGIAYNNEALGVISGNELYKCATGIGSGPEGTVGNPYNTMHIANNHIDSCGYGITLGWFGFSGAEMPINCVIAGNNVTRSRNIGINLEGSGDGTSANYAITGNVVDNSGNTAYDGTTPGGSGGIWGEGIWVFAAPNVAITGNVINNMLGHGILITSSPQFVMSGNNINLVSQASAAHAYGINDNGPNPNSTISGNVVSGSLFGGVICNSSDLTITGNNVRGCLGAYGLLLNATGQTTCILSNNTATGNQNGIGSLASTTADSAFVGNVANGNTTAQYNLTDAGVGIAANNIGYNPVGISTPAFAGSGTAVHNTKGVWATIYFAGLTGININGQPFTEPSGTCRIPPHGVVTPTYTSGNVWAWVYE